MKIKVNIFLLIIILSVATYSDSTWVHTRSGLVIGSEVLYAGRVVKRFLGIPYAEPPVGNLRFKKTVPVHPWSLPYMATVYKPSCPQHHPYAYPNVDTLPGQSENCLHLNIWVPGDASSVSPKSVMFWIHGGGFRTGSNRLPYYDGQVLAAEQDVIVVTINYRLGILGFLSTSSEEAPGNMGMYDALEALKWINDNIEAFGGNSKSITLFGHSAGSLICGYFIFSPLTSGLFHRVIMESVAPDPSHRDFYRENLQLGQKVAESVHCASHILTLEHNPEDVLRCLKNKSAEDLNKAASAVAQSSRFWPVYGKDILLPSSPFHALHQNHYQHVDVMIGFTRDEGSMFLCEKYPEIFGPYGERNPRINRTLGEELIKSIFQDNRYRDEIADHYLYNLREDDYDAVRNQTFHALGDKTIVCSVIYFSEVLSFKAMDVYSYYYNHQYTNTHLAPWTGVSHFMEVPLVFGRPFDTVGYTEEERVLSKKLMEFWVNFTKNGYPSATWKKYSYPEFYTEQIQTNDDYDNYEIDHALNCEYLMPYILN